MNIFSVFLVIVVQQNSAIDSIKNLIEDNQNFTLIIELNDNYRKLEMFDSANAYLKKYENQYESEEQAQLNYLIAENLFFKGELLLAREQYLRTVAKFSNARYANEALERLYLFESARKDTVLFKKLIRSIYHYEIRKLKMAEDSLRALVNTSIGGYALYYLALIHNDKKEFGHALSALEQLNKDFPANRIHQAKILTAEIYYEIGKKKEAVKLLEELVVKYPNAPIGIKARELLKHAR
ncbi:MAG: tetratricopeptide repeat protein [bacterium]